ncbi:pectin lyase fold/virulence factor [Hyaloraphidium curvatum]|nr:pectin lyase fold/virulence factor [Hyaloraphidium curvatum]
MDASPPPGGDAVQWTATTDYAPRTESLLRAPTADVPFPPRAVPAALETADDAVIAALLQHEEELEYARRHAAMAGAALPPAPAKAPVPVPLRTLTATPISTASSASGATTLYSSSSFSVPVAEPLDPDTYKAALAASGLPPPKPVVEVPLERPKSPWYRSPWFICILIVLLGAAIITIVALITQGVIQVIPPPPRVPPVWIDWYNATAPMAAPGCPPKVQDPALQPSYARFPIAMPRQPDPSVQQTIHLNRQYGLDETAADNFPAFQRALSDCRNVEPWRGCRLIMDKGVYRFASERVLYGDRLTNLTIEGNSSTFLFSRRNVFSRLLAFSASRSMRLADFSIDWDWSVWRLASLVQIDSVGAPPSGTDGAQQLRMRFLDHPFLDLSTIRAFVDMHGVDPQTLTMGVRTRSRGGQYWQIPVRSAEVLYDRERGTNNTVVLTLSRALAPAPDVGGLYMIRHFTYEGHALQFADCEEVHVDRVNVFGAPGMALAVHHGSANVRVTNFTVGILANATVDRITRIVNTTVPDFYNVTHLPTSNFTLSLSNGTNFTVQHLVLPALQRRISTTVDGLNFLGTSGLIHVEDSEIGFQGDDCANVNQPVVLGISRESESDAGSTLVLRDWQELRMGGYAQGDVLEFRNPDFSPTGVERRITRVLGWRQGAGWVVGIEGRLPTKGSYTGPDGEGWTGDDDDMIVFNLKYNATSYILFRRLHCHSNRSRGILFQAAAGDIEYSCFTNIQKRALSVTAEVQAGSWAEGMGVRDFVFARNEVRRCDKLDDYLGAAWTGVQKPDGSSSAYPLLRGIRILNNTFAEFPRRSVFVESAQDVVVSGNVFSNAAPDEPQNPERGQLAVGNARDVVVAGNTWTNGQYTTRELLRVDAGTTRNVTGSANALV